MGNYNIDKLLLDFFKNKPIVSFFSFIFVFFYVGLTIFFPKYSGTFISKINSLNKNKFIQELLILGCIYFILWVGVCLHYYIHQKFVFDIQMHIKLVAMPVQLI